MPRLPVEVWTGLPTYFLVLAACAASVVLPIWLVKYPPLVDYPNSLARSYIIYHFKEYPFDNQFVLSWKPWPYLAMDAVVVPLQAWFDIEVAGKIFLTAIVGLFVVGCHQLGRQIHGRESWLAPCCSLLVTNSLFLWGFVNYMTGLGLYLIAFAAWLRARRQWKPGNWAVVAALAMICYLAHLSSFVFLGVSIAVVSVFDRFTAGWPIGKLMIGFGPLVGPIPCYLMIRKDDGIGEVVWNNLIAKLINLFSVINSYNILIDSITALLILTSVVVMARFARSCRICWPTFTVGLIFGALFLIHPKIMLGASGVDVRYVPVAVILMTLSLNFGVKRRLAGLAMATFLGAMSVRQVEIWQAWSYLSRQTEAQLALADQVPKGSRVLPLVTLTEGLGKDKYDRPFMHTVMYLTLYRHCFIPTTFANRGLSLLTFRTEPACSRGIPPPDPTNRERWNRFLDEADYVWAYKVNKNSQDFLAHRALKVDERGGVVLFRIENVQSADRSEASDTVDSSSAWVGHLNRSPL